MGWLGGGGVGGGRGYPAYLSDSGMYGLNVQGECPLNGHFDTRPHREHFSYVQNLGEKINFN